MFHKTTVFKVLEVPRKTTLVACLLNNLSFPIHPLKTLLKTDSTANISCECSENF